MIVKDLLKLRRLEFESGYIKGMSDAVEALNISDLTEAKLSEIEKKVKNAWPEHLDRSKIKQPEVESQ